VSQCTPFAVNRSREALFVKKPGAKATLSNVICFGPDGVRILMTTLPNASIGYVVLPAMSTSSSFARRSYVKRDRSLQMCESAPESSIHVLCKGKLFCSIAKFVAIVKAVNVNGDAGHCSCSPCSSEDIFCLLLASFSCLFAALRFPLMISLNFALFKSF
jgi:hypothetical protein